MNRLSEYEGVSIRFSRGLGGYKEVSGENENQMLIFVMMIRFSMKVRLVRGRDMVVWGCVIYQCL